jgi:hypothetical protein
VLARSDAKKPEKRSEGRGAMYAMMTLEQQRIFGQAVEQGLVKNLREAYEVGCAELRRQLQKRKAEDEIADKAEAEAFARNQLRLF